MTDVRPGYTGETRFPLIFQNLHRYMFYLAVLFIVVVAFLPGGLASLGGVARLRRWWRTDRSAT